MPTFGFQIHVCLCNTHKHPNQTTTTKFSDVTAELTTTNYIDEPSDYIVLILAHSIWRDMAV